MGRGPGLLFRQAQQSVTFTGRGPKDADLVSVSPRSPNQLVYLADVFLTRLLIACSMHVPSLPTPRGGFCSTLAPSVTEGLQVCFSITKRLLLNRPSKPCHLVPCRTADGDLHASACFGVAKPLTKD